MLALLSFDRPAPADGWPRQAEGGPGGAPRDRRTIGTAARGRRTRSRMNDLDGRRPGVMLLRSREGRAVKWSSAKRTLLVLVRARREVDPPLPTTLPSSSCPLGAGAWWHGGAVLRRAVGCGRPVRPSPRRRGRPRSGRPQAPLDAGESIKAVAEHLGHSDPGFTLRTYTHLLPSSEQRTRQAVDRALTGGAGKVDGLTTA